MQTDPSPGAASVPDGPTQPATADSIREARMPARIGRFAVLAKLGQGGMGVVYSGYDEELDRRVAIKVLRSVDEDATRRLRREAKAMAKLSHPNVAQVYEVGTWESQIYVALEFIRGETFRAWSQRKDRSLEELLDTLCQAGEGLRAAHEAGLVHRDFKPDNVMVGRDGRVRVLDFGLAGTSEASESPHGGALEAFARDLEASAVGGVDLTATGTLLGTPAYMSPEQFSREKAGPASDQFSFCVTVYEALFDERPFAGDTAIAIGLNVLRGKLRETPTPRVRLPPGLTEVVLKGLATDPESRHADMATLVGHLRLRPIRKRGRWFAAGVGAVGILAAAGYMNSPREEAPCGDAGREMTESWTDARRTKVREVLEAADRAGDATTAELVDAALERYAQDWIGAARGTCEATVRGEQSDRAETQRFACLEDHRTSFEELLGVLEQADTKTAQRAVIATTKLPYIPECSTPQYYENVDRIAEAATIRTALAAIDAKLSAGQYADAKAAAESTLAKARELGHAPTTLAALNRVGEAHRNLGEYEEALSRAREGYVLSERGARTDAATNHRLMGDALQRLARTDDALVELRKALDIREVVLGLDHPLVGATRVSIGSALWDQAKYDEALAEYEIALSNETAALGPSDPRVASVHNNIGNALMSLGRLEEAVVAHEKALAIRHAALGPKHPMTATSYNNLGATQLRMSRMDDALASFRKALEIRLEALGPDHPEVAASHGNVSVVLLNQGKNDEALAESQRAYEAQVAHFGPNHPQVALSLLTVGNVLLAEGRLEEALTRYEESLEIRLEQLGDRHPDVALSRANVGITLGRLGEHEKALAQLREARDVLTEKLGPTHARVGHMHNAIATQLYERGDLRGALEEARASLDVRKQALPAKSAPIGESEKNVGTILAELGQPDDALPHLEEALTIAIESDAPREEVAARRFGLCRALWDAKEGRDRTRAQQLAEEAKRGYAGSAQSEALDEVNAWLESH